MHIGTPATETVGAGMALAKILHNSVDVRPDLKGGWAWTQDRPFPPLSSVLKCALWSNDLYQPHRDMLLRAAPVPSVQEGGQFITMRVVGERTEEVPVTEVIIFQLLCGFLGMHAFMK